MSAQSEKNTPLLLPGDFEIYVEACDESQACGTSDTPLTVSVQDKVLTESEIEETIASVGDLLKVGKLDVHVFIAVIHLLKYL